ncbi:hypothetical protein MSG28_001017 [Choristoneura fumiferana]|uniref:Uncharacterized protein n=1 Tax=Choristoneura fumiferana TaxID=7141 RepID=A0ACC0K3R3_CHOFU|nr:hypothetical protein MSG28_001017 [Choristoneura fumiferana]
MAKMLIRTNQVKCKVRMAVAVRVILFFGIPLCYFLARYVTSVSPSHLLKFDTASGLGDGFTVRRLLAGFVVIHCVLAIYCFLLLGTVCEQYFVPAIDIICERLDMEEDVAGATFMAAASSSPELFINCVGTFVTQGDLGVGAVVGSAVFNVLAVIELDWWSVSRDCLMYAVSVVALILTLLDDKVLWHEALVLVLMYTLYILAMVFNDRLGKFVRGRLCYFNKPKMYTEITPLLVKDSSNSTIWPWPDEKTSGARRLLWILTWPISLVLWMTVPDCRRRRALYPLTFIMCIVWIGGVSYLVAWIITIIGHGTMGISNSIGSNTFDILLCLGLPWLVKSLYYPATPGDHWVIINSSGLSYNAISLLSTLFALYGCLALNKFQLDWKIGLTCAGIYVGYLVLAALIELNVFFPVNLPICPH